MCTINVILYTLVSSRSLIEQNVVLLRKLVSERVTGRGRQPNPRVAHQASYSQRKGAVSTHFQSSTVKVLQSRIWIRVVDREFT